ARRVRRRAARRPRARARAGRRTTRAAAARPRRAASRWRAAPAPARRAGGSRRGRPRRSRAPSDHLADHHYLHLQISAKRYICKCNHFGCEQRESHMSVKEISRAALSEALLSRSPPVVIEALDRKYYDIGHIPTARMLPPADVDKIASLVADKAQV